MYCTVEEVTKMIKDDMMNVIIGDEYIEDKQEREAKITKLCEDAISDACAEIDGYLAKRYKVPFTRTPQVISKFAKDMAVYLLDVAKGIISIGVEENMGGNSEAANGFNMQSSDRVFSRASMRGW